MSLYSSVHKWFFLSLYGMMMQTECLALQSSGAQEPPTPIVPTASTISSSVILMALLSNFSAPSVTHNTVYNNITDIKHDHSRRNIVIGLNQARPNQEVALHKPNMGGFAPNSTTAPPPKCFIIIILLFFIFIDY